MSFDLKLQNGDLVLNNGDFDKVVNSDKLIQDILKIALTDIGSNIMFPWYGSSVSKSLIGNVLPTNITLQIAQNQLQNSIENLQNLQNIQIKAYQPVTAEELINGIVDISVNRNSVDLRLFDITIKVLTKSFKTVDATFTASNI